jgi:hypothetical protein
MDGLDGHFHTKKGIPSSINLFYDESLERLY